MIQTDLVNVISDWFQASNEMHKSNLFVTLKWNFLTSLAEFLDETMYWQLKQRKRERKIKLVNLIQELESF